MKLFFKQTYSHYSSAVNTAFLQVFHDFFQKGVTPIFFSDYPQRAETFVQGYSKVIGHYPGLPQKMLLYGGRPGENPFPDHAEQFGYAANYDNFTEENVRGIAQLISPGSYAIALYEQCPDIELRTVLPPAVDAVYQYHSQLGILLLENKQWLEYILECAELSDVKIPQRSYSINDTLPSFQEIQRSLQSEKVVLQGGLTTHGGTSGSDTVIIDTERDFSRSLLRRKGNCKCARYISGLQGNYSVVVGNVRPNVSGYGCYQSLLPATFDSNMSSSSMLREIMSTAAIQLDEVIVLPVRGTAKIVGEPNCTRAPLEGAVHDLGYIYPKKIRDQLYRIATKLGVCAAKLGYVGILGFDFIVDSQDKVWVNEINARQQGPTAQLGAAAEKFAQVPDCLKLAYVFAFSTQFHDPDFKVLFQEINRYSYEISEQAATSPGPYYLKIQALHSTKVRKKIKNSLVLPSVYNFSDSFSKLTVCSQKEVRGFASDLPKTSIAKNTNCLLLGSSLQQGDEVIGGTQLFRVAGIAVTPDDSPVEIGTAADGNREFKLRDEYKVMAQTLQRYIFGS